LQIIILQNELLKHLRDTPLWKNENVFILVLIVEKLSYFKLGNIAIALG
jgi:hypothetical protein